MEAKDTVASWKDDGWTYSLRNRKEEDDNAPLTSSESPGEMQLIHKVGSESAVWAIGNEAICKVKWWDPELESEAQTIAFVNIVAPRISTPKVIYTWTEHERSFLIITRVKGSLLRDAWASLSLSQRHSVVHTIGAYCDLLADNKSRVLKTATGKPLWKPYLSKNDSGVVGFLTSDQCMEYFSAPDAPCPTSAKDFFFYHPDLGPANIILSDDGSVAGVLDWEGAGYYPDFWIATKPSVSPGLDFDPPIEGYEDGEWRKSLRIELQRLGYPRASEWYMTRLHWKHEKRTQS